MFVGTRYQGRSDITRATVRCSRSACSLAAVGSYRSEPENVAEDHDQFLDEVYRS